LGFFRNEELGLGYVGIKFGSLDISSPCAKPVS
jgi:hypothetical protein